MGSKRDYESDDTPPGISVVTNPERFIVTHDAADRAIAELVKRFDVEVSEATDDQGDRQVTLTPPDPACNPLRVLYTSFPGVMLFFADDRGGEIRRIHPWCGCDYCNDNADEIANELTAEMLEFPSRIDFAASYVLKHGRSAKRTYAPWPPRMG